MIYMLYEKVCFYKRFIYNTYISHSGYIGSDVEEFQWHFESSR